MNIDCSLVDASGKVHRVVSLVVWTQLCRFPLMVARIEGVLGFDAGPFTFKLECATNETAALKTLAQSRWHMHRRVCQASTQRTFLELVADPGAHLEVHPFAMNEVTVEDLVKPLLHPTDLSLKCYANPPKVEAIVCCGETLEQFSTRLATLTGCTYRLCTAGAQGWTMEWAPLLQAMSVPDTARQGRELASIHSALESGFQKVGIPNDAATELLLTGSDAYCETAWQPVQIGWMGSQAVTFGSPSNQSGEPLSTLSCDWGYLTEIEQVPALWTGARITLSKDTQEAHVLTSIFVYTGEEYIHNAGAAMERVLGGHLERQDTQHWLCATLSVSPRSTPESQTLIQRIIDGSGSKECLENVLLTLGLPNASTGNRSASKRHNNMPAVVVKNPLAPKLGPVGRTEDGLRYRSKIWVQILGVRGPIELDWAMAFASHDNASTGGTKGGDFVLVPSEFTLGYVTWIENGCIGAPFFLATTHYRNSPISEGVGQDGYIHGLVTNNGLLVHERTSNVDLNARDNLNITSTNTYERTGHGSK
jgi:hypothetical protein